MTLPLTLRVTGTLIPDQQSDVTPIVAGRVMQVMVERGSVVTEGQPLMRLRDVDFRSSLALATASLAQARARLGLEGPQHGRFDAEQSPEVRAARANMEVAEDAFRRVQQLAQSGSASDQDLRRAQSQAQAAREQYNSALNNIRAAYFSLQAAQTSTAQARRNVGDSVVRAPFSGEVSERRANVGEYVAPQRAIVTLVRTNPLRMEIQVPQERVADVRRGQAVEIRIDAFPGETFAATVQYISAAVRQDTRSLVAEAVVPNDSGRLRPGMFATAAIDLGRTQQAVVVPSRAVTSEGGSHRAFVIVDGRAHERIVQILDRDNDSITIASGIQPNENVATERLDQLSDGAAVFVAP